MSYDQGEAQAIETQRPVTPSDLEAFRRQLVAKFKRHHAEHLPNVPADPVTIKRGRKYTRVFNGATCYCFVVMATGDILRPASWKTAIEHPRGNIHNKEPLKCCGPYGVAYVR